VGTEKGPFNEVWKETDVIKEDTKILYHPVHSRLIDNDGHDFMIYPNIDKWEEYLLSMAPEDSNSIRKLCDDMKKSSKLDPFQDPPELRRLMDYIKILFKIMPSFLLMMKYGNKTIRQYIDKLNFRNKQLKGFLTGLFGEEDFSALVLVMMLGWFHQHNAGYLIGGSLPIADRMTAKFTSLGGKLTLGKKVKKIIVENKTAKGIILEDGTLVKADYVISAADGYSTLYNMLEGKYMSEELDEAYKTWKVFTPIVQVSFGINKSINSDYMSEFYLSNNRKIGSTTLKNGYTIMNYCFDPTMAPEGKTSIVIRYESPWDLWKDMSREEYLAEKEKIKTDATALLEQHYPGIKDYIEVMDVASPLTCVRYTGVWKGSYEGFLPSSKNISKTLKMTLPGLDNFYMVGQWLQPGGGLPPSGQSGKWVAKLICKKDNKEFIVS
jgi:phytoene dehydrogenase-like protein